MKYRQPGSALIFALISNVLKKRENSGQKLRGSALVFVLIIIAGIVTVTVGAQRLSLVQFNQANLEEDNLFAYYAAKSALEDGLLRFRYQRNVETAPNASHRFDVTDGVSYGEVNKGTEIDDVDNYRANHQYYDLELDFRANQVGDFTFTTNPPVLVQDDELQLTGFPNDYGRNFYLRYAFQFEGQNCQNRAFVQLQQIVSKSDGSTVYSQAQALSDANNRFDSAALNSNLLLNPVGGLSSSIRIRAYHCSVKYAFATSDTVSGQGGGPEFDSLTTTMTATGYYGQAKRTLQALVDRESGTIISIYDFNLYAGEGSIRP
jgi:hypothetical protein